MQDRPLDVLDSQEFLDEFFADELSEPLLEELDRRMVDPQFNKYYEERLTVQYDRTTKQSIGAYLPMIIMILLILIGLYLLISKQ